MKYGTFRYDTVEVENGLKIALSKHEHAQSLQKQSNCQFNVCIICTIINKNDIDQQTFLA